MELTSGLLSREEYLRAVGTIADFLRSVGARDIGLAYGFGCDCPDEQLYQDVPMKAEQLQAFIEEAESTDYYRVGKDNLHLNDGTGRIEFLFCHESDVHFVSEDRVLVERLKAKWLAEGFCRMFVHLGSEWEPVKGPSEPGLT